MLKRRSHKASGRRRSVGLCYIHGPARRCLRCSCVAGAMLPIGGRALRTSRLPWYFICISCYPAFIKAWLHLCSYLLWCVLVSVRDVCVQAPARAGVGTCARSTRQLARGEGVTGAWLCVGVGVGCTTRTVEALALRLAHAPHVRPGLRSRFGSCTAVDTEGAVILLKTGAVARRRVPSLYIYILDAACVCGAGAWRCGGLALLPPPICRQRWNP